MGHEVIDAPANVNYSTSYLFSNGPIFHTGLKADYAFTESFGAMVGVFNDTNSKIDLIPGKHFGAQLSFVNNQWTLFLNYIGGKEDELITDSTFVEIHGQQIDLTATFQATPKLGLGLNASSKMSKTNEATNSIWSGIALYAHYDFSHIYTLGFRGEWMDDPDGMILGIPGNRFFDLTLSGNINIGDFKLIPEFRIDQASKNSFVDKAGLATSTSAAFILAAMYAF